MSGAKDNMCKGKSMSVTCDGGIGSDLIKIIIDKQQQLISNLKGDSIKSKSIGRVQVSVFSPSSA